MVNKGFIKLPRHIIEDSHYFSEPFTRTQAWVDLIILANYQDTTALVTRNQKYSENGNRGTAKSGTRIQ